MRFCKINMHFSNVINTFFLFLFILQKCMDPQEALFTPGAMFYYEYTHFISRVLDCWQKAPHLPHCKAWRGQDIL